MSQSEQRSSSEIPVRRIALAAIVLAWTFLLFAICGRTVRFWDGAGTVFFATRTSGFVLSLVLFIFGYLFAGRRFQHLLPTELVGGWCLLLLFLSDWLTRGYNFFQGPAIRGELLLFFLIAYFIFKTGKQVWLSLFVPVATIMLVVSFFFESDGRLLFSDDHSVFFYRLQLLTKFFPHIPFYNPLWNAGIDARDFFASGSLNVFFLFSPLLYISNDPIVYNIIVISLLTIILPLSLFYSARLFGLSTVVAWTAALLSLSTGLVWYRWGLKYGTLGFIFSSALVPLNLALGSRFISKDHQPKKIESLLFVCSLTMMLFWSLSGFVFVPFIVLAAFVAPRLLRSPRSIGVVISVFLINAFWIAIFLSVSKVGSFVSIPSEGKRNVQVDSADDTDATDTASTDSTSEMSVPAYRHKSGDLSIAGAFKVFSETAISTNPLILIFALPGIFLFNKKNRLLLGATLLWLLLLGTFGVRFKPQLELDRMLVIATIVSIVPAALALTKLFERVLIQNTIWYRSIGSLAGAFLCVGPFVTSSIFLNRTTEQYYFASSSVESTDHIISEHAGEGRTLFTGFVLHELSQGHLAPLALMTNKPLAASSFVHNLWKYQQIIPKSFLENKDEGIEKYFDLMNATLIVAHEEVWRNYFFARPSKYREVGRAYPFIFFKVLSHESNYFLSGKGAILTQNENSLQISLKENGSAVLKFTYFPFLRADKCEITPYKIDETTSFIQLSGCPTDEPISIRSRNALWRVFNQ